MMEFVEYMKIKKRMLQQNKQIKKCFECPLSMVNNNRNLFCNNLELLYPEKAEAIVKKWAEEHLQKTILQAFLEEYPNTILNSENTPQFCPSDIGYKDLDCINDRFTCKDCWNQPVPDLDVKNIEQAEKYVPDNNEPYKMPAPIKITWDKGGYNPGPYCQKEE